MVYSSSLFIIICTDKIIGFEESNYAVMEGYAVEVCLNATVKGVVNRIVMATISTADFSTMGKKNLAVLELIVNALVECYRKW